MATLATNISFQCLGLDGKPLAGGKVWTYEAGTTTPKTTYTTMQGNVPNSNPVILDQNGKAKIYLGDGSYRLRILDSDDALVDDIDQISRYVTQSEFAAFQQTVSDGVSQLTEIQEQIDVYVNASIGDQKGFANGIAPLDANVKVDPIYLPVLPNTAIPQATESIIGVAEVATQAEVDAATDDAKFITPKKMLSGVKTHLNASGSAPIFACRAWVNLNGTNTTIRDSGNISSVTDDGVGICTLNFITAMQDANYIWTGGTSNSGTGPGGVSVCEYSSGSKTATSLKIYTSLADAYFDSPNINVAVFR